MRTLLAIAALTLLAGCSKPACPGFERTDTGSGCRNVTTGAFVERSLCEECGA